MQDHPGHCLQVTAPSAHHTTPHNTALHCTALHCTTLHYKALHNTTPHHATRHRTAPHDTTQHHTTLHGTAQHCTALHYTKVDYMTLHYTIQGHACTKGGFQRTRQHLARCNQPALMQHSPPTRTAHPLYLAAPPPQKCDANDPIRMFCLHAVPQAGPTAALLHL